MALAGDFSAVMGRGSGSFIIWTQIGLQGGEWQTRLCRPNGAMAGGRRMASTRGPMPPMSSMQGPRVQKKHVHAAYR